VDHNLFKKLHAEGTISDESFVKIQERCNNKLFSVHLEIKTLLYVGILMLTTGLGVLVYKNIDTIGHQAILALIAAITIGCFFYCFKHKRPFSTGKVQTPNTFFDYLLLLGTLCLLIFIGYLQYQYKVFGDRYGMATFIPMVVLFYIAYDFDHMGIQNLAITNLGIWLGVTMTPKNLLLHLNFDNETIIYTYLGFGLLLLLFAWLTVKFKFKKHFQFSYQHFGVHVSFISLLSAYFFFYQNILSLLWLGAVFVLGFIIYKDAFKHRSFYFLLLTILYSYVALSSLVLRGAMAIEDISLPIMYFIASSILLVVLLIHLNQKLKES
jgi:hypothetical protein